MKLYIFVGLLCCQFSTFIALPLDEKKLDYTLEVSVLNLVNAEEFLNGNGEVKLDVKPVGPFVYDIQITKTDVIANENGTVSFNTKKTFTFNPQESIEKDDKTLFTVANVPLLNAITDTKDPTTLSELITASNSQPFVKKTVKELLWGYEDPLLALMKEKGLSSSSSFGVFLDDKDTKGASLTVSSSYSKNTPDSSQGPSQEYDTIDVYNGETSFSTWGDEFCDKINGTDFMDTNVRLHPAKTEYSFEPAYYLNSHICRPLKFSYEVNETDTDGLELMRFAPDDDFFGGVRDYPENTCFCKTPETCPEHGTVDLSKCKPGLILSWPYFVYAEDSISSKFSSSFQPEKKDEKNDPRVLDINPETGKIEKLHLSLQWNVGMKKVEEISQTHKFQEIILPLVISTDNIKKSTRRKVEEKDSETYQVLDSMGDNKKERKGKSQDGKSSASTLSLGNGLLLTVALYTATLVTNNA